tara:strand:+ start:63 stop:281 length:219 start_codon:yes stop_codon:yes gene_type:complete
MLFFIFRILDWFDRGPQPTDGMVGKIKKDDQSKSVDIYGRIRDSSHTPITKDANDETIEYDREQHEDKKDSR